VLASEFVLLVSAAGLEIVLTFGAAYGCHFVTEDLLGASGLLAVVVMGFSMSILGESFAASAAVLSQALMHTICNVLLLSRSRVAIVGCVLFLL
jgi:NhaP-type Na+/H+ or K+/H+ antiporter